MAVIVCNHSKHECNEMFNANVEALTSDETDVPTMPCVRATGICYFTVQDADGKQYSAEVTGMKSI